MKIFVISLINSHRRDNIKKNLDKYNIPFEFVDAITPHEALACYDLVKINKASQNNYKRNISELELACSASHVKVYKKIIEENIDWAVILEDDAQVSINFKPIIEQTLEKLPRQNIYLLGGQKDLLWESQFIVKSMWDRVRLNENFSFQRAVLSNKYIFSACSYLISREVAKNLYFSQLSSLILADDWKTFHERGVFRKIFVADIITHPNGFEDSFLEKSREELTTSNVDRPLFINKYYLKLRYAIISAFF